MRLCGIYVYAMMLKMEMQNHIPQPQMSFPTLLSVEEAQRIINNQAQLITTAEDVPLEQALRRITAEPVTASIDVPGYDNSAMDGYAIRSVDLQKGTTRLRITQRISAGDNLPKALGVGEAARIFTGAALPEGADAIAIQEDCQRDGDQVIVKHKVAAGTFVRRRGNDIPSGTIVLPTGECIRPQEIGVLAAIGHAVLRCKRRLRVGILSSGNELVLPPQPLLGHQIYNSNRYTLLGMLATMSCEIVAAKIVPDDFKTTCEALQLLAAKADLIITTGGASVGEEDHLLAALQHCGRVTLYKVRVKPGKPLIFGNIGDTNIFGLPGNPVSTMVAFMLFVRPFMLRRLGCNNTHVEYHRWGYGFSLPARFCWLKSSTRCEFVRVRLEVTNGQASGVLLYRQQGSDVLQSMVWADGLAEITEGRVISHGDPVTYFPFSALLG